MLCFPKLPMIKVVVELAVGLMNLGSKDLQNTLRLSALFSEGNKAVSSDHGHQLLSSNPGEENKPCSCFSSNESQKKSGVFWGA